MSTFDYALMLIGVGVIAAALSAIFGSRRQKDEIEIDLCQGGYAPGSDRIPPEAWFGALAVICVFLGLFSFVGSAVFIPR